MRSWLQTVEEMEVALAFIFGQNKTKRNHFMPAEFAEPNYGLIAALVSGNDMLKLNISI